MRTPVGSRLVSVVVTAVVGLLGCAGLAGAHALTDTTPPILQQPPDITTPATADFGETFSATVNYAFTVSDPDNTAEEITVSCNDPLGTTHLAGTGYVTCQAHDPAGNPSSQVMFTVTVTVPPPTFQNVPGPITFQATGAAGAVVTFVKPTAVDVGGRAVTVNCDQPSGITYPVGTTTVTCTATIMRADSQGNPITYTTGTTQFSVTVTPAGAAGGGGGGGGGGATGGGGSGGGTGGGGTSGGGGPTPTTVDSTAPAIGQLPNAKVYATSPRGATFTYGATATDPDNAAAQIAISCNPASGSTYPLGPNATSHGTVVTCRAHDAAGNEAAPMLFTVVVVGAHDQLTALEAQVQAASLKQAQKVSLRSDLVSADRSIAAGADKGARTKLAAFIKTVERLPVRLRTAPTMWIRTARRVVALLK
jgi:hypothetical protein